MRGDDFWRAYNIMTIYNSEMEYNNSGLLAILFRNTDFYPAVMRNRVGSGGIM